VRYIPRFVLIFLLALLVASSTFAEDVTVTQTGTNSVFLPVVARSDTATPSQNVHITSPAANTTLTAPAHLSITAQATASTGTIRSVEFFAGTSSIGATATAPYSITWYHPAPGSYALTAKATDSAGRVHVSAPVAVTVGRMSIPETQVTNVIHVDQQSGQASDTNAGTAAAPLKTFTAAAAKAEGFLRQGQGTKIVLHPGTYRENVRFDGHTKGNQYQQAVLVIEGTEKGKVILSGSDVAGWEPSTWTPVSGLPGVYSHPWTPNFGFFDGRFGKHNVPSILGHRREMIFINGQPLTQMMVEDWSYTKATGETGQGIWNYNGYLGPQVLTNGTFGVAEQDSGQPSTNTIFIKPPTGINFASAKIEVAMRPQVFSVMRKHNVVLRNLVFEHATSRIDAQGDNDPISAVTIGSEWPAGTTTQSRILLEDSEIRYNNANGLGIIWGTNFDIRRTTIHHNGVNGIGGGYLVNSLWEELAVIDNGWRAAQGGWTNGGWTLGGIKFWCSKGNLFQNVTIKGNGGQGLWFDGNNLDTTIDSVNISENTGSGIFFEISAGPFRVRNSNISRNQSGGILFNSSRDITVTNSTLAENKQTQILAAIQNGGRSRSVPDAFKEPGFQTTIFQGSVTLINNRITTKGASSTMIKRADGTGHPAAYPAEFLPQFKGSRNIYWNPDNTAVFDVGGRWTDLAGWQTATRQDSDSHWQAP